MADIEKTKATEAEKTEYAEPDMRPEKLIKQQEREAKMTPDELYAELKAFTAEEAAEIDKAFRVAREAHKAQLRYSGQPYIIHPIAVSNILLDLGMDAQSVEAALLHDTVEDTDITLDYIKHEFGDDVAALVDGVTKLGKVPLSNREEQQAENIRKMLLAMSHDIRVIIIKLADRIHNMRTLSFRVPQKRRDTALETLEIYAPIAHRLGIRPAKEELEDLSIRFLDPIAYKEIEENLKRLSKSRLDFLESMEGKIRERITGVVKEPTIEGRIKSVHGIYRKMYMQNKNFAEIYDVYAIRIIVDSVIDCYNCLGVIHDMFRPLPGRFKDYISTPKPNMYQSLHTTLIASNGQPFEVQIRTYEMHRTAEYGIAAHWKYKEGKSGAPSNEEAKLSWLRQMLEWQTEMSDNKEFLSSIKSDLNLFSDNIYCFTPTGDVKNLPAGSCPVDFAYSIHSAVGNKMVGARVNGKLVTIDYELKSGDRVEIITSQNSKGPSRDWLNIVKSTQARNKINQWFKQELKEDNILKGKELITNYCKTKGIVLSDIMKPENQEKTLNKYGFKDWNSLLASVGHGGLKEGQVVNKLVEENEKRKKAEVTDNDVLEGIVQQEAKNKDKYKKTRGGIVVKGIHDVAVRFSKCCNPVPGDEIVGFVTRGRGVTIHRTDCVNVINFPENERERLIEAEWEQVDSSADKYSTEINIFAANRTGLIVDISRIFTEANIDVKFMNSRVNKKGIATINLGFDIHGKDELNRLVEKLRNIEGVTDIARTAG